MRMVESFRWVLLLAVLAVLGSVGALEAQVFTPTFMAPRSSSDVGIYLSDGPGDFSVEGIWRRRFGRFLNGSTCTKFIRRSSSVRLKSRRRSGTTGWPWRSAGDKFARRRMRVMCRRKAG